jgi:hypothetical protein
MHSLIHRIRRPVRREGADRYLRFTLLSFAASVIVTRLFLALTGYPQVGNSQFHVAHVLWGGLLLFIATLLPLVLANRWVYITGAVLSGAGVGLFIDEVGKFITQNNDYFYPAAAPIIYAFFLLTVLVYLQVRRPPARDARAELYRAFDSLQELLDQDLDAQERAGLEARLRQVASQADHPDLVRLANALLDCLASDALYLAPDVPSFWERWQARLQTFEIRWGDRRRLKTILAVGLGVLGVWAFANLVVLLVIALEPGQIVATLLTTGRVASPRAAILFVVRLALEGSVGLLLLVGTGLLAVGQERRGISIGYFGLLLSLTTINLLVFYFDQFSAVTGSLIQFGMVLGLAYYRRRYLAK